MNTSMSDPSPSPSPSPRARMYKVLTPIERKDGTTFWMRVGTGFPNKDQSVNVYLDAIPVNHKFQLREMDEEDFTPRKRRDDDTSSQRALGAVPF